MNYNIKRKEKLKSNTRCYDQLCSILSTSRFFVLNILADLYISVSGDSTLTIATSRIFVHRFCSYFL